MKEPNLYELLLKAAERLDNPDEAATSDLLGEFFSGLESAIMGEIADDEPTKKVTGPFAKAQLAGMFDVLETVNKMSDADLRRWLGLSSPYDPAKTYDHGPAQRFDASTRPDDPNAGIEATPSPRGAPGKDWVPTTTGRFPGSSTGKPLGEGSPSVVPSSSPAPGMAKSFGDFLDAMANATPEEIDRAKSGLSQLDPDVVETLNKAVEQRGQLLQTLEFDAANADEEAALYMGRLLSETELRKGIVVNAAKLMERIAKMRDRLVATERVDLVDDGGRDDDWEQRARRGNA